MSGSSGYLNQVEACRCLASQRLEAARVADDPPEQRQRLQQAVELAVRAVLTAWRAPAAKPEKLWAAFEDPISGLVGSDTAAWGREVRTDSGSPLALLHEADTHLGAITSLADDLPPKGWIPPGRSAVGWDDLSEEDRRFLTAGLLAARAWVPAATLWLFGSRATGDGQPDSDYDVLLVVPDETTRDHSGVAMGFIWNVAAQHGVTVDHNSVSASSWRYPDDVDKTLVAEVRACGIQVPEPQV